MLTSAFPLHNSRDGVLLKDMKVVVLAAAQKFMDSLDSSERSVASDLITLLEQYGHLLKMPVAKPIGKGLWKLRAKKHPAIRLLYGFNNEAAIVVLGLKKQHPALLSRELSYAQRIFAAYCSI
jgi:phage-related protein